jgi:hypothetical protein
MTERWGKQDIFFLQRVRPCHAEDGKLTKIREPVADKPFVRRIFKSTTTQHTSPTTTALTELVRRDISLFSLGVVLVELWFERGIEELGSPRFDSSAPFNDNSIYETASQYIGELWRTAGENYSTAVSRCLHGLNRPMGTKSLESLEFKNAVHVDVVCLLEKNLEVISHSLRHMNIAPFLKALTMEYHQVYTNKQV